MTKSVSDRFILDQIDMIEESNGVEILLAVEYGSRAWGLDGVGSDHDIRLIYRDEVDQAFSLFQDREMISHQVTHKGVEVDLTCWSLPKALRLATVSNPQLNEFLACPVKYRVGKSFTEDLTTLCCAASPRVMAHYYRGSAKKNLLHRICDRPEVDVKACLQMVRATLSAQWFVQNPGPGCFPPVNFEELRAAVDHSDDHTYSDATTAQIDALVAMKREGATRPDRQSITFVEQFGLEQSGKLPQLIAGLPDPHVSKDMAERAFKNQYPDVFQKDEVTFPEVFC